MGKSECLYNFSKIYFYDLEEPGTYEVPNWILQNIMAEFCKTYKTGTVLRESGPVGPYVKCQWCYVATQQVCTVCY
jgi:hypothetical protein